MLSHLTFDVFREHSPDLKQCRHSSSRCQGAETEEVHPAEVLQDLRSLQRCGMQVMWLVGPGAEYATGAVAEHQEATRRLGTSRETELAVQGHGHGAAQGQIPEAAELAQALRDLQSLTECGFPVRWPAGQRLAALSWGFLPEPWASQGHSEHHDVCDGLV